MLKLRDIRKSYQIGPSELPILKGVNLDVQAGELMAIMGQSGSGKSTLMNIMGLLDQPTSGEYLINGQDVTMLDGDQQSGIRNKLIGFVFQSFFLLPRLTAAENVGLPLIYRGLSEAEIRPPALEMLERVGMASRADHRPNELSGGQQQRVAIARALVGKPALILADEPTGALDTQVSAEIMTLFKTLNAEEQTTMIMITHDPGVAQQCSSYLVMRDGLLYPPEPEAADAA